MPTGPRVTLEPIPMNLTTGGALWLTAGTAGYDTGSPGGTITAWSTTLGVMIPNYSGNVFLEFACGATPAGICQVLLGQLVDGQVMPATTVEYTITANSQGWLGPWSPSAFSQKSPTTVTYTGGVNTTALTSAAQQCVVVDFTTTTTLAVRARSLSPVTP